MSYKSILVNIDIDGPVTPLIKLAVDLARRLDARLIGCAGADIVPPFVAIDGMMVDGDMIARQRVDIEERLKHLEKKFLDLCDTVPAEWRGDLLAPTRLAVRLARTADLILTGSPEGASAGNAARSIDLGDLLLHAGRPVLIAAANAEHLLARKVLVAWKDTREARRAVADAMPFLTGADEVALVSVSTDPTGQVRQSVADVVAFLQRHGVKARSEIIAEKNDAAALKSFAASMRADMTVSGAYGHSRLRELIFGGVTRSLFDEIGMNRLMSS